MRIITLDNIPVPSDPGLSQLATETGLITVRTAGMTFGHGILLKKEAVDRRLVAHELAHVFALVLCRNPVALDLRMASVFLVLLSSRC